MQSLDVILAEVVAVLNLDKDEVIIATIGDSVCGPAWDVDRVAGIEVIGRFIESDLSEAGDDEPVFSMSSVALVAEPAPGAYLDPLHLVGHSVLQDGERTPRALVVLTGHGPV